MSEPIESDDAPMASMGWFRAIVTAIVIAVIGVALLAFGTNELLTRLSGLDRSQRVGVATTYFVVVLGGLAWGLRRLQQRGVI